MELGNVLLLVEPEQDPEGPSRVYEPSERIVGVQADVVEQRFREKNDLERSAGHGLAYGVLTSAPLQLELLRGLVVLVIAPLETAVWLALRSAAHQTLHVARSDPGRRPFHVAKQIVEDLRQIVDPLVGHDAVFAEDDDHVHQFRIGRFGCVRKRKEEATNLMRMHNLSITSLIIRPISAKGAS